MNRSKLTQVIASLLIAVSIVALNPIGASAEWKQDNIGWKWYKDDGNYAIGWQQIDGNWYYFYYGGYMAHDTFIDRGNYYVGINGAWTTCTDSSRVLEAHHITFTEKETTPEMAADLNRKLSSGLTLGGAEKKIENSIRKLAQSGATYESMRAEVSKEAKEYGTTEDELRYITSTGNTAWKQNDAGWWFEESNSYAIGWRWIDGHWYHFDSNGYMEHDKGVTEKLSNGGTGYYKLGPSGHIVGSTASDPEFMRRMQEANK